MVLLTIQQYQELQSQCEATESRAKQTVNENSNLKIEIKRLNHLVDTLKSLEQVLRDLKSL
jgi:regulator of replication initiation timing